MCTSHLRRALPALAVAALLVLFAADAILCARRMVSLLADGGDGDIAGLADIGGGRRLYLECCRTSSPTVVLVAGYGNRGSVWSNLSPDASPPAVLPGVAGVTRVCADFELVDADRSDALLRQARMERPLRPMLFLLAQGMRAG
jgi:hypothetical protein